MPERPKVRERPRACPWVNYPTHAKNRELQVNGDRPVVYGYCPQEPTCGSCAGTFYKPNLLIEQGRPFTFVPCPYCSAEAYQKRVAKLRAKMPLGSGPPSPPGGEPPKR